MEENNFALALEKRKNWMISYGWIWIVVAAILISIGLYNIKIDDVHQFALQPTEKINTFTFTSSKEITNFDTSKNIILNDTNGSEHHFEVQQYKFRPNTKMFEYTITTTENYKLTKTKVLHFKERKNILQLIVEYYIR